MIHDLYIPESRVFVEVFGLFNHKSYKIRMGEKIKFYDKNNIKCLYLYEEHFKPKDNFKDKMDVFLTEIKGNKYNNHIEKIYLNNKNSGIYEE